MKKTILNYFITSLVLALLAGCATGYQPSKGSFTGGFNDKKSSYNQYSVAFNANGFSDMDRALDLAMLRVAELCLNDGYNYFVVVEKNTEIDRSQSYTTGNYIPLPYGGGMYMSNTTQSAKPGAGIHAVAFLEKPLTSLKIYTAQEFWDQIAIKYKVNKIVSKKPYNSTEVESSIKEYFEMNKPKSMKKYSKSNELIKTFYGVRLEAAKYITDIQFLENPFIEKQRQEKFINEICRKYGANVVIIYDNSQMLEAAKYFFNEDWIQNNKERKIKNNFSIQLSRTRPVHIGLKYNNKIFKEEARTVIRLLTTDNAKKSGLMIGDEILLYDGKEWNSDNNLYFSKIPGDIVTLTIARDGSQLDIPVQFSKPSTDY